jgi:hypothetical protein
LKPSSVATPIALVALAAATAAYAFFVDRSLVSDGDRAARKRDVFPSFRVDEVRRIELWHGAEDLILERTPGPSWTMTSPRHESADPAVVDVLMRELEMATRVRDVPPAEASGMETPRVRGRVTLGALEYRFVLGGDAPRPEGAAYMRVDGEGTFVAGRSLSVQLLRGADAYRDHALVRYGASQVARLELRSPKEDVTIERAGSTFRVGDGNGLRASRATVDRLFAALAEVRADSFIDDAQADEATVTPSLTVTLIPRDAARPRVRLLFGGACPGDADRIVVVRAEPERMSACAPRGPAHTLEETPMGLVDTSPLFARADEIEDLRLESLEGDGPRVDIARRGPGWRERAPEDRDLTGDETDSANALAGALASGRALDATPPGAGDRMTARWRVTAVRTGAGTTEVVELASPTGDGAVLARRLDDGAILHLPAAVARRFEPHPVALRSLAIWQPPFDAATVVAIDDSCTPARQRLDMRDGVWRIKGGKVVDSASADDLVGTFAHARADSWVTESDDGTFGLSGTRSCSVAFTLATDDGGARRVGMVFGAAGEGGVYARTLEDAAVLVSPATLREAAEHGLH